MRKMKKNKTQECVDYGLVTVLMSVYKTDRDLLERSVNSILNQTYSNIEFIIVNDGANEDSLAYLYDLDDERIKLIHNPQNIGLAASLNKGIELSRGKYIARMDVDDYSLPERIYEQVKYMENHEDIDVLACISMDIDEGKLTGGIGGAYYKFDNESMKIEFSLAPKTFPHPTVMFRTSFLIENNVRYDERFLRAQDYDMWARCSMIGKLDSLQKVLFFYDKSDEKEAISDRQAYYSDRTKLKCLQRLLPNADDKEKELYLRMRDRSMYGNTADNIALVYELIEQNKLKKVYNIRKYSEVLYFWWGRKMLYAENRKFFTDFIKDPLFMLNAIKALLLKTPEHIMQQRYVSKLVKKTLAQDLKI